MVNVYIKEGVNDQTTRCAGGRGGGEVASNTTYLGANGAGPVTTLILKIHLETLRRRLGHENQLSESGTVTE